MELMLIYATKIPKYVPIPNFVSSWLKILSQMYNNYAEENLEKDKLIENLRM